MNGFKTVVSKELFRVFKDKKMIFSMFILPVVMVMLIFGIMFFVVSSTQDKIEEHVSNVYIVDAPQDFIDIVKDDTSSTTNYIEESLVPQVKDDIFNGNADLLIEFPKNFKELVSADKIKEVPQIKTYYNPSEEYSEAAHTKFTENYIEELRKTYIEERYGSVEEAGIFTVDSDNQENVIQDNEKATGKMLGMFIPYIITMMLFAGAMALGVDVITGEKERGTLASLLLCPVKRSEIAFGKIVALAILSLSSSLVYLLVMFIAFGIVRNVADLSSLGVSFSLSAGQILELTILIIGIVLLYVAIIGAVSVVAKTVKEAQTYISPIYFIVIIVGMITMNTQGKASFGSFIIPLYNVSVTFKAIFMKEITMPQFLAAAVTTYLVAGLLTAFITKAFKSEKTIFTN